MVAKQYVILYYYVIIVSKGVEFSRTPWPFYHRSGFYNSFCELLASHNNCVPKPVIISKLFRCLNPNYGANQNTFVLMIAKLLRTKLIPLGLTCRSISQAVINLTGDFELDKFYSCL